MIALVCALGGSASAAVVVLKKNSVLTQHIRDGQVRTGDLSTGAVTGAKVKAGSIGAAELASGVAGMTSLTPRDHTGSIPLSCTPVVAPIEHCQGQATITARCQPGELATGGGHGEITVPGGAPTMSANGPAVEGGRVVGWQVRASAFLTTFGDPAPAVSVPVTVVCGRR